MLPKNIFTTAKYQILDNISLASLCSFCSSRTKYINPEACDHQIIL